MVNINVPAQDPFQGFYLAHQGSGIVDLNFQQVTPDTPDEKEGHMMDTLGNEQEAKTPKHANQGGGVRTFRNYAGAMRWCVLCKPSAESPPPPFPSSPPPPHHAEGFNAYC